jgi:predicted GNAT family acetyltransferase
MLVKLTLEETRGAFHAFDGEQTLGEMTFSRLGEHDIIVDHTGVREQARGRGVGRLLFDEMVSWSRKQQLHVIPLCPFAARLFETLPEVRDVLKQD